MKASIRLAPVCFALAGVLLLGCNRQDDERDVTSSAMAADDAESQAAVAAGFNEAMDSMSDTNVSNSSGTSLSLAAGLDVEINIDRSCAAADDKAVVTLAIDKTASWERSNARIEVIASSTIENQIIRTWSKDGSTLGCAINGKFAAIDFEADLTGYSLDVTIDRTANRSLERTLVKSGETTTKELASTVKGTRHVEWKAQETLSDGSISRSKSIRFTVDRSDNYLDKDGVTQNLDLSVATTEDLQVTVIWDTLAKGRQLLSKTISSGQIKASHAADGHVEASFSDLLLKFDASSCSVYSGSMEAKIYAEGSTVADRSYLLTALEGTITVKDVTDPAHPKDVDDFDYSPCDIKDFSY